MNNKDENKKQNVIYLIALTIIFYITSLIVNKLNFQNNFYEFLCFLIPALLFHIIMNKEIKYNISNEKNNITPNVPLWRIILIILESVLFISSVIIILYNLGILG